MIHFVWPWAFAALPLPWVIRYALPAAAPAHEAALQVPAVDDFRPAAGAGARRYGRKGMLWAAALAWLLLVTACARSQWLGDPVELPVAARDIMLAVDLSGSMSTEDFSLDGHMVSRLAAIKTVAGNFIDRRVGDRIGLILFGTHAYLQAPLTFDRKTVHTLLDEAQIGLAGKQTAIGDAIGLAIKRLRNVPATNRVLILLTDGANTAGEVDPVKAAQLAAKYKLKIYTIGIGSDAMAVQSLFGTRMVNPSTDLDVGTLTAIATATGGRFFRAKSTGSLEDIYHILDRLEPVDSRAHVFRPRHALFYWPLGAALLIAGAIAVGEYAPARRRWRAHAKVPAHG